MKSQRFKENSMSLGKKMEYEEEKWKHVYEKTDSSAPSLPQNAGSTQQALPSSQNNNNNNNNNTQTKKSAAKTAKENASRYARFKIDQSKTPKLGKMDPQVLEKLNSLGTSIEDKHHISAQDIKSVVDRLPDNLPPDIEGRTPKLFRALFTESCYENFSGIFDSCLTGRMVRKKFSNAKEEKDVWQHDIPAEFLHTVVTPTLKPGKDAQDVQNYREIANESLLSRIFQIIFVERCGHVLTNFSMSSSATIDMLKCAFRTFSEDHSRLDSDGDYKTTLPSKKSMSETNEVDQSLTIDFTITDGDSAENSTSKKKPRPARGAVWSVSTDFKSAFCRISSQDVVSMFLKRGGDPVYARFLLHFLRNRTFQVEVDGIRTKKFADGGLGVIQGSTIGGFLFQLVMDDYLETMTKFLESKKNESSVEKDPSPYGNTKEEYKRKAEEFKDPLNRPQVYQALGYVDDSVLRFGGANWYHNFKAVIIPLLQEIEKWSKEHGMIISPKSSIHLSGVLFKSGAGEGKSDTALAEYMDKLKKDGVLEIHNKNADGKSVPPFVMCSGVAFKVTTDPLKFLGTHFDNTMGFEAQADAVRTKARSVLADVRAAVVGLSIPNRIFIVNSYLKPVILGGIASYWLNANEGSKKIIGSLWNQATQIVNGPSSSSVDVNTNIDESSFPSIEQIHDQALARVIESVRSRPDGCPIRELLITREDQFRVQVQKHQSAGQLNSNHQTGRQILKHCMEIPEEKGINEDSNNDNNSGSEMSSLLVSDRLPSEQNWKKMNESRHVLTRRKIKKKNSNDFDQNNQEDSAKKDVNSSNNNNNNNSNYDGPLLSFDIGAYIQHSDTKNDHAKKMEEYTKASKDKKSTSAANIPKPDAFDKLDSKKKATLKALEKYSADDYGDAIHAGVDGSCGNDKNNYETRSAFCMVDRRNPTSATVNKRYLIGNDRHSYYAEFYAIHRLFKHLKHSSSRRIIIYTDSLSVISRLRSGPPARKPTSAVEVELWNWILDLLKNGCHIRIVFVYGHSTKEIETIHNNNNNNRKITNLQQRADNLFKDSNLEEENSPLTDEPAESFPLFLNERMSFARKNIAKKHDLATEREELMKSGKEYVTPQERTKISHPFQLQKCLEQKIIEFTSDTDATKKKEIQAVINKIKELPRRVRFTNHPKSAMGRYYYSQPLMSLRINRCWITGTTKKWEDAKCLFCNESVSYDQTTYPDSSVPLLHFLTCHELKDIRAKTLGTVGAKDSNICNQLDENSVAARDRKNNINVEDEAALWNIVWDPLFKTQLVKYLEQARSQKKNGKITTAVKSD